MFKITLYIFFLLFLCLNCWGQQKKAILIYSNGDLTFIPLIQKSLDTIAVDGISLFDHVTNLDEISSRRDAEKLTRKLGGFFDPDINIKSTSESEKDDHLLAERLREFSYFLNIHVSKLGNLLELQFYLYKASDIANQPANEKEYFKKPLKPIYYNSAVVDLTRDDYRQKVYIEIAKMFPEVDKLPIAIIANGQQRKKEYFLALHDTISFNGLFSSDQETPVRGLKYFWYRKNLKSLTDSSVKTKYFIGDNILQKVTGDHEGTDYIYLKVFDGVHYSKIDSIILHVAKRPIATLRSKNVIIDTYETLFGEHIEDHPTLRIDVSNVDLAKVNIKVNKESVFTPDTIVDSSIPKKKEHIVTIYGSNHSEILSINTDSAGYSFYKKGKSFFVTFITPTKNDFLADGEAIATADGVDSNPLRFRIGNNVFTAGYTMLFCRVSTWNTNGQNIATSKAPWLGFGVDLFQRDFYGGVWGVKFDGGVGLDYQTNYSNYGQAALSLYAGTRPEFLVGFGVTYNYYEVLLDGASDYKSKWAIGGQVSFSTSPIPHLPIAFSFDLGVTQIKISDQQFTHSFVNFGVRVNDKTFGLIKRKKSAM